MPQVQTQFLTHTFSGGWATDFGPTFYGEPDGTRMRLPWLNEATNCIFEFDGGPHKAPGTNRLDSNVIESSQTVTGIYDYWRMGTAGTPTQRRVVHVNDKVYHDGGAGTFTGNSLTTGLEVGAVPQYSTFDDLLIICGNGTVDVPKSWDQSTFQNLAGGPARFSFTVKHAGKQWGAGNWAAPSRLYYSVTGDPEDWASAGSGSIDVDPGDGDRITAIWSYKNDLWVFKGPYKQSIHRITGSTPSAFARTSFVNGLSAANQACVFPMGDDLGFVSPRGTVHSLKATDAYGDYNQSYLNYPILTWCRNYMNQSRYQYWQTATDHLRGYTLITFPLSGYTTNNRCLMLDWRFMAQGEPHPRWAPWDFGSFASLGYTLDTSNRPRIFAGGYDGYVYRLDQSTRTHNSTSINFNVKTPFLTYGSEFHTKSISIASVGFAAHNANTGTFGWTRDTNAEQTQTFTQSAGSVLDSFLLDTDVLGGALFTQRFLELEDGGDFRSVQYRINDNNNNGDLEVHNIGAALTPTGYSTEN